MANHGMKAEIIAVGSELLTPYRMDTNSLSLAEGSNRLGIEGCPAARVINRFSFPGDVALGFSAPSQRSGISAIR